MVDMWLLHGHISGKLERKLGLKICDKITTFHIEQKLAAEFVIEMHGISFFYDDFAKKTLTNHFLVNW